MEQLKTKISKDKRPIAIKSLKECKIFKPTRKIFKKLKKNYLIFVNKPT